MILPIATIVLLLLSGFYLMPIFRRTAALKSRSAATDAIHEAVLKVIAEEPLRYSDIITFEKDENGQICALSADVASMNEWKARLSLDISENLKNVQNEHFGVPLGNLSQSAFLMGKGPEISFSFSPLGAVTTDFVSTFSSAGINQTCHRIYLEIRTQISVLMPLKSVSEEVTTSVCVAETVIVGAVPDAFTNVQNIGNADDSISGDVVDFGAHNFLD